MVTWVLVASAPILGRREPGHAELFAALSYYDDHQQAFDATIEEQLREVEALRAQAGESPVRQRLRALGKLP